MTNPREPISPSRGVRLLHLLLTVGVTLMVAILGFMSRVLGGPVLPDGAVVGYVLVGVALVLLMTVVGIVRPSIPARQNGQEPDAYWHETDARGRALLAWCFAEGAGILAAIAFVLTEVFLGPAVMVLAIVVLVWLRPSRIEEIGAV